MARKEDSSKKVDVKTPDVDADALREPKNKVSIEAKATFELDDAKIFDLNGEGIKMTVIAVN